ncbi:hypothetical protein M409DRAFT_52405 [Zasmidium cellare ATCC 36951]|uniref:SprT-like domain-containing protein n=1 Tax=Zasmidium cellare ATCC 36951 TaxID=1080233 RepID=A0A6A6CPT3_ZASCE|nr:uncharacterized protein M409DRAFT_52405 [Zasmidium cellare ATCC 36951]KAF2169115.1 hypothetical protein M409DRAFT_52405 [Zasmidium cellare ATCC 36951]
MSSPRQICEQHWSNATWQTCTCPRCEPRLHTKVIHHEDLKPFNLLRGLTWRGHDAWRIASLAVSSFTGPSKHQKTNQKWIAWAKKHHLFEERRAAADCLDEEALNEVVEIFSDIFLLRQLPSSKISVRWAILDKNQLGFLQSGISPRERMILRLNCDHTPLQNSAERILCVVLHEMAHAFFDYYACNPWIKAQCAQSNCGKLYHLNIGTTGHGRAWQYLINHMQHSMRDALGFEGDLGRKAGMCQELEAGGTKCASSFPVE